MVAQEIPNLLVWVRFLRSVLDTPWCNGNTGGSEPPVLGSNPGGVALEGSAERSASGLENRAGRKAEGSIPLLSALEDVARGRHSSC